MTTLRRGAVRPHRVIVIENREGRTSPAAGTGSLRCDGLINSRHVTGGGFIAAEHIAAQSVNRGEDFVAQFLHTRLGGELRVQFEDDGAALAGCRPSTQKASATAS